MKLLYQVFFTVAICSTLGHSFIVRSLPIYSNVCAEKDGYYCTSCHELLFCPPEGAGQGVSVLCKDMDPKNSYCSETGVGKATCQSISTCAATSEAEVIDRCERTGRYPDPLNCGMYQQCSEIGQKAVQYACPVGTRFDAKKEICYKPTSSSAPGCYSFSATNGLCTGKFLQTITYPTRPDMYVRCDGKYKPETCKSIQEQFDTTTFKCEFKCQEEGFFTDSESEQHFFTCVKDGTKWIQIKQSCNTEKNSGFRFDVNKGFCVKGGLTNTTRSTTSTTQSNRNQLFG